MTKWIVPFYVYTLERIWRGGSEFSSHSGVLIDWISREAHGLVLAMFWCIRFIRVAFGKQRADPEHELWQITFRRTYWRMFVTRALLGGERTAFYSNLATTERDHTVHSLNWISRDIGPEYGNQKAKDVGSMILLITSSQVSVQPHPWYAKLKFLVTHNTNMS